MGNVVSRCANEITSVFRSCRSKKSEDERTQKRNFEPRPPCDRHQQRQHQAEADFEEVDGAAPEHSRELLDCISRGDDCLPECDQRGAHGSGCLQQSYTADSRGVTQDSRISKEFMIQTYRISRPSRPATSSTTSDSITVSSDCARDSGTGSEALTKSSTEEFQPKTVGDAEPKVDDMASDSCATQPEWKKKTGLTDTQRVILQPNLTNYLIKRTNLQPATKIQPKTVSEEKWAQRGVLQPSEERASSSTQTQGVQSAETVGIAVEMSVDPAVKGKHAAATDVEDNSDTATKSERENNTPEHLEREASVEANTRKHLDQQRNAKGMGDKEEQVWKGRSRTCGSNDTNCLDTLTKQSGGEAQVPERVRKLEQRQEAVLKELQKLQQSLQSLVQQHGVNLAAAASQSVGVAAATASSGPSPLQSGKLHDLVISADPSSVPLSLLVLLKQLSSQCQVLTSTFVHSSATDTPEKLRSFLQNGAQARARSSYQLAITVVWKKASNSPRMMVSPTRQTYIEGEANIARYLSRLLLPAYDSGDIVTATQVDEFLDLAQQQILRGNNKERSAALRTLNARLGKGQWLVGSSLTVADIVAWSAVQGAKLVGDAPANVKKWLKLCADSQLFEEAVQFLSS